MKILLIAFAISVGCCGFAPRPPVRSVANLLSRNHALPFSATRTRWGFAPGTPASYRHRFRTHAGRFVRGAWLLWAQEYHHATAFPGWAQALAILIAHPQQALQWPYRWVDVTTTPPERLRLWQYRRGWILTTLANTGIDHSTAHGSWPIVERERVTSMSGVTPDGVRYTDPHIWWVNYFHGNDAVHAYPRNAYGFPQSAGCVEVSLSAGKAIFALVHLGTIVTIQR